MVHIFVGKLTIIGSYNGRHKAIIWNNAGILITGPLGIHLNGILIEIHAFSIKKIYLKMSSEKGGYFAEKCRDGDYVFYEKL